MKGTSAGLISLKSNRRHLRLEGWQGHLTAPEAHQPAPRDVSRAVVARRRAANRRARASRKANRR